MKFIVEKVLPLNELVLMNRLGYHVHTNRYDATTSYVKRLRGLPYPRFHVYLTKEGDRLIVALHLDEKQPSYAGTARHAGQYDSEVVRQEAARIQLFISQL